MQCARKTITPNSRKLQKVTLKTFRTRQNDLPATHLFLGSNIKQDKQNVCTNHTFLIRSSDGGLVVRLRCGIDAYLLQRKAISLPGSEASALSSSRSAIFGAFLCPRLCLLPSSVVAPLSPCPYLTPHPTPRVPGSRVRPFLCDRKLTANTRKPLAGGGG